jgi:hypothetical protein
VKKLIFFLIITLLFANNSYAKKKYFKENYIFKPDQKIKWLEDAGTWSRNWDVHAWQSNSPWALQYSKDIVRDGEYSLRFEKRKDDCGPNKNKGDCIRTSAKWIGRSEVSIPVPNQFGELGSHWYSWSIYIPEESDLPTFSGFVIMGQFKTHTKHIKATRKHVKGSIKGRPLDCPELNLKFYLISEGLFSDRQGVTHCNPWEKNNKSLHNKFFQKLIDIDDIKGKWHDIVVNANWTDKEDKGFIKIWVNGEQKLDFYGKTLSKMKTINGWRQGALFRFGAYSQKWPGKTIVYYDSISRAKNCKKLLDENQCQKLTSQTIKEDKKLVTNGNSKEFVTLSEKCKSLTKYGNNWYYNKCDELNSK